MVPRIQEIPGYQKLVFRFKSTSYSPSVYQIEIECDKQFLCSRVHNNVYDFQHKIIKVAPSIDEI